MFNILWARALSGHAGPNYPVIIDTVNPGFTISELRRNVSGGLVGVIFWLMETFLAWPTEVGASVELYAVLAGQYIGKWEVREVSDFALSAQGKALQDKMWVRL